MSTSTRVLVSLGIGYVGWAVCSEFMGVVKPLIVMAVLFGCTFALTKRYPQD